MSPKLFRPVVEMDVRPDPAMGGESSLEGFPKEPKVLERPLAPSRGGGCISELDFVERLELIESFLTTAGPGAPNGALVSANVECVGEGRGDA